MTERVRLAASSPLAGARSRPAPVLLAAYVILIAAMMFDFRAVADSAAALFLPVFVGTYAIAFAVFLLLDTDQRYPAPGLGQFVLAGTMFLTVGVISGLTRGQSLDELVRLSIPTALYLATGYATCRIVMVTDLAVLRRALALLSVGYIFAALLMQRVIGGPLDFSTARYQILSGATIPALGYLECMALFGLGLVELGAMASAFLLLFLSVTRTYIISAAAQLLPLAAGARRLIGPRLLALAVTASVFLAGVAFYGGEGVERWTDRVFNQRTTSGEDYTLYTRQTEWDYMINSFQATSRSLLFGNGIAARTVWYFPREVGGGSSFSVGFGHSQHLSLLFIGGLVGGGTLLAVQFLQLAQALLFLARLARTSFQRTDLLFLGAWGATIIIGVVAATFFSSMLNNRSWALWYGIGTGLFIGARARYLRDTTSHAPDEVAGQVRPRGQKDPASPGMLPPAVARRRAALQSPAP